MKILLVVVSFLFFTIAANCQNLLIEGTAPDLYVTHTVAPKEGFYSVGRLYNQNPKTIASFNELVMEKGLTIGQKIKIPLNNQNLGAGETAAGGVSAIPLTHLVGKSETLFKIGTDFNVTPAQIKLWNQLSSDNIAPGTPLVVGHLKMTGTPPVAPVVTPAEETKKPVIEPKKDVAVEKTKATEATPKDEPFVSVEPAAKSEAPVTAKAGGYGRQNETATPAAEKPVAKVDVVKELPKEVTKSVEQEPASKESIAKPVLKEETKTSETRKVRNEEERKPDYSKTGSLGSMEGVFAGIFAPGAGKKSLSTKSGDAATFKSTSGWQDKKYYVLMDGVAPGTILKIASSENKVVYAKVLGNMPEMKENVGLLLRMSNAAASYLGIIDPKFPVEISYYQ